MENEFKSDTENYYKMSVPFESPELANDQSFWELKAPIDDLKISINPPDVEMAVIKRLGEPSFWNIQRRFSDFLSPIYAAVSHSVGKKKE